jgi:hypothetical protein
MTVLVERNIVAQLANHSNPKMRKSNDRLIDPCGIRCSHCDRMAGNFAGGFARSSDGRALCHPNVRGRPDCYHLVTNYAHEQPCIKVTCYEDHDDPKKYLAKPRKIKGVFIGKKG